jgi:hypothetical protein
MAVGDFRLVYLHLIAFLATIAQDVGGREHTSLAPPSPGLSSSAGTFSSTPTSTPASDPASAPNCAPASASRSASTAASTAASTTASTTAAL